jgi:pantetheine-phosphate adenylyltransferase
LFLVIDLGRLVPDHFTDRSIYIMKHIGVYPGTFDPVTKGHIDLVERSLRIFDELIVAISANPKKRPLFSLEERMDMFRKVVTRFKHVRIEGFDGLLVDYVREKKAAGIIRGLRAVSDFEYEMQMALMNRRLNPDVETVFMMPAEPYTYVSSRLVKEVVALGGSVKGIVPEIVERRLREKKLARETLRA